MGCLNSKGINKDDAASNKKIESQLKQDRKALEHEVKLLLLGMLMATKPSLLAHPSSHRPTASASFVY
jgi:hypothetical protein